MSLRVLVAGGGTGGHLFPGLAVADEIRRRDPAAEVTFAGTEKGIEVRAVPAAGYRLELLAVSPLKGRTVVERARGLVALPRAGVQAITLVRRAKPDLVLGVGGYASGPVVLAAALSGVPTALLEQNARPGLTNRILARFVRRVYVAYDEAAHVLGPDRAVLAGNPVRRAFVDRAGTRLPAGNRVLVLGGSQGAHALDAVLPDAMALVRSRLGPIPVLHQCGKGKLEEVARRYRELDIEADVRAFVEDVATEMVQSSLLVCRAGAMTTAELCVIGRPSILVPYPFAADDHQGKNAEALERLGASVCLRQDRCTPEVLASLIVELTSDRSRLESMAASSRKHGKPDALERIVDDLLSLVSAREKPTLRSMALV